MRIFKLKEFDKWAKKIHMSDKELENAVDEIEKGLIESSLGGNIYKKRVALEGKGKSGSPRTIIAYKKENRSFFIYGFEKNTKSNITEKELKALKIYGKALALPDSEITRVINSGKLIEIVKEN